MSTTNSINAFKGITIAVVVGSAIAAATTALLPSTEISITDSCQIDSRIQKLKSAVQGQRYWVKQLQLLDDKVRYLEVQPERITKVQQMVDEKTTEVLEKNRQFLEELYSKYPEFRPPPGQTVANELRKQADAIEHAEVLDRLERMIAKRIRSLESCRPAIFAATVAGERTTNPNK
jgi:hypothetical protein